MKNKEKPVITIRKEIDYDELLNKLDEIIAGYSLTYIEILGILELLKQMYLDCIAEEEIK